MWKHKHYSDSVAETTERTDVTGVVPAYLFKSSCRCIRGFAAFMLIESSAPFDPLAELVN